MIHPCALTSSNQLRNRSIASPNSIHFPKVIRLPIPVNHDIRILKSSDIPGALKLCRASGWNQLATDWHRLIEHEPDGCFAVKVNQEIIATATTTCYGTELAWIGMMLVHEQYRRQGIAKALITNCLEYLRSRHIRCIKLDATPVGKMAYGQLGFRDEWSFHRWRREGDSEGTAHRISGIATDDKWNLPLDQTAFGVDRRRWLNRLAAHSHTVNLQDGSGMIREGHLASYIGPMVAATPSTATQMINKLLAKTSRTTFWDVPQPNQHAVTLARDNGFLPVRDLTRMWTGRQLIPCDLSLQYALSDPGTG